MLDSRDKLITWFCQNNWQLVQTMKAANHFPEYRTDHPFHGEGSTWTHTMMVMVYVSCMDISEYNKRILLAVAMLHDIGKPRARIVKEFGDKFSFEGHEGLSTYMAIDILRSMEKVDNFYDNSTRKLIIELISLHGTDIKHKDPIKLELQTLFRLADKGGAVRNIDENIFAQYPVKKVAKRNPQLEKHLIIMVGLPGSGKTTFIKNNKFKEDGYEIINRDDVMNKYYLLYHDTLPESYNEVYDWINQEEIIDNFNAYFDKIVNLSAKHFNKVVIDMTMLTFGKRRNMLNRFSKFIAKCYCLLSGYENIQYINDQRVIKEAGLTKNRLIELQKKFTIPIVEEGFESVNIILKD